MDNPSKGGSAAPTDLVVKFYYSEIAVWPEILLWLQQDPESTAKSLMERLQRAYPGRSPEGQLRTLQRRIREWRHVMALTLVHACLDGNEAIGEPVVAGADGKV